jgi:hypothetical protein
MSGEGATPSRQLGMLAGKIHVPDDFDDNLPDELSPNSNLRDQPLTGHLSEPANPAVNG